MSKTVLVVDDSCSSRLLLTSILRSAGYQVIEAADGKEALSRLEEHPADLIITDLEMPRLDGITMLRQLRASGPNSATPVVMLTGAPDQSLRDLGAEAGAQAWLVKPYKPVEVLAVARHLLERKGPGRAAA